MNKNFSVRFHLGRGENYLKWQILHLSECSKNYVDPNENNLVLKNCLLRNNPLVAKKIYEGEHKTVCAWIICEKVDVVLNSNFDKKKYVQIHYNPKEYPHWTYLIKGNELLKSFENKKSIDEHQFKEIRSIGKSLYALI